MKLHRYVDHQRLHIVTKDVISLSISVLLLFRHYISHKITFGAPSSGGVLCSACGAFISFQWPSQNAEKVTHIKGRLLDQAVILMKWFPFQNGLLKKRICFQRSEFFPL